MIAIAIYVRLKPESAGHRERAPYSERFRSLIAVWPVLIVFIAVVGGIYGGIFTPTEAAAIGAFGTGVIALFNGGLNRSTLKSSILTTASATGMIFLIVFGAGVYNAFLALSQLPQTAAAYVGEQGFNPWMVMVVVLILYLIFGCVMDSLSMILLTVPIFFPIMSALDFGLTPEEFALWFGIIVLIVVEVGLITPPVGMNLFVINSMAKDTPLSATYRGRVPLRHDRHHPRRHPDHVPGHNARRRQAALLSCIRVRRGSGISLKRRWRGSTEPGRHPPGFLSRASLRGSADACAPATARPRCPPPCRPSLPSARPRLDRRRPDQWR